MHNKNILVDREQGEYKFNTKYIVFLWLCEQMKHGND
jgi:hypothetical protein